VESAAHVPAAEANAVTHATTHTATHASSGKGMRRHGGAEHDNRQEDHCIALARIPLFNALIEPNGDCRCATVSSVFCSRIHRGHSASPHFASISKQLVVPTLLLIRVKAFAVPCH
jgi:hypothetical protein